MAILNEADRAALWAEWMRDNTEACGITKADLRQAVNAVDNWVDANVASFNTAIPQPARGALTTSQKSRLLSLVIKRRFETGA